jgi:hypothetical protein
MALLPCCAILPSGVLTWKILKIIETFEVGNPLGLFYRSDYLPMKRATACRVHSPLARRTDVGNVQL